MNITHKDIVTNENWIVINITKPNNFRLCYLSAYNIVENVTYGDYVDLRNVKLLNEKPYLSIGKQINLVRKAKGYTVKRISEESGIDVGTIKNVISKSNGFIHSLTKITQVLGFIPIIKE